MSGGRAMRSTITWIFLFFFAILFLLPLTLVRCGLSRNQGYKGSGILVKLYVCDTKRCLTLDLEEYIKGVVAAEMPAEFEMEALKAQAVAARTVTVRRLKQYGGKGSRYFSDADFSDDPAEGQAWLDGQALRKKWGWSKAAYWKKICRAVEETRGLVVTHQGRPIDALYHSTSGPQTENAGDLWGQDVPYLKSVACPYGKESPRYQETVRLRTRDVANKLGVRMPEAVLSGAVPVTSSKDGIAILERSNSGRVKLIRVGGVIFRGDEFRRRLGLRSTNLRLTADKGQVVIESIGYGHGVGLCQYGANGLAKQGADFRKILTHYYTGVEIRRLAPR